MGNVGRRHVNRSGWNRHEFRFIEGRAKTHVQRTGQHGAVSRIRMRMRWNAASGLQSDPHQVRLRLRFCAQKPRGLQRKTPGRIDPVQRIRQDRQRNALTRHRHRNGGDKTDQSPVQGDPNELSFQSTPLGIPQVEQSRLMPPGCLSVPDAGRTRRRGRGGEEGPGQKPCGLNPR